MLDAFIPFDELPSATGPPLGRVTLKHRPEDFRVSEVLGYDLEGEGQHLWLWVRKKGRNSEDVAKLLAKFSGAGPRDVGYAGMKDRNAVTEQWFSVDLKGRSEPDWSDLNLADLEIVKSFRHRRKLKTGGLSGNSFRLVLRDFDGDLQELRDRVETIRRLGVPNYFGPQRFGRDNANVATAYQWLFQGRRVSSKKLRGILLSTVRAMLFNRVLGKRVRSGQWNRCLRGDLMMLDGSNSIFPVADADASIARRLDELDIHPTGPLPGKPRTEARLDCADLETEVLQHFREWVGALEDAGVQASRRALRIGIGDFRVEDNARDVEFQFTLPSGAYATTVIRELVALRPDAINT